MCALENTAKLLQAARPQKVPVASCYTAYMNERDMPYRKISTVAEQFRYEHPCTQLDPRIRDRAYDIEEYHQNRNDRARVVWF